MPRVATDPVFRRPGSKFWQIRYTDHHHREIRCSSGTEVYEEAWVIYRALKDGSGVTFTEVAERFFDDHKMKPKTKSCYQTSFRSWVEIIGNPRIEFIDRGTIQKFVSKRLSQVKHGTIRNDLAFMSSLLKFAQQLPNGPTSNVVQSFNKDHLGRSEERVRYLRPDQTKMLLGAILEPHRKAFVMFGLEAGLRRSEIANLRLWQVNLWRRLITLVGADTKTAKGRVVPMTRGLIRACIAHLRTSPHLRNDPSGYLLPNPDTGKPYTDLRPWWNNAVAKAGLEDFHFHDTRHHFASTFVQRGGRLQITSALLGHTSVKMTERYAHLSITDAADEFRRINKGIS
jgi:integrase/recombinase XerD